ncbi:helix-turn-helix domain-containing protein [Shimia abyssi]|uniref:Cytoskeletal protein RodZ n=1 Tax=Shimia abyssi TaxID=1662395 RepID=A0A2P8FFJ0_9RHOB|nr:RodZ domain-containing protein [Shimia abyssi]PSL20487.1 cytoskeletal protein RodZ [Shimia abyssi]
MIGRKTQRESEVVEVEPKGFDDFELRLGDTMRGERATLGKSLLDVQRELRIRASYISAIENSDPTAFETPGFIAGYVRSYARYLGMDPEEAYDLFCEESGFVTAHGMSAEASTIRKSEPVAPVMGQDPFASPNMPFTPVHESILSRIEPRAIGSSLVLVALIAAIGYGGWSVLNEIQRVTLAPVEQKPVVLSDLDPVAAATQVSDVEAPADGVTRSAGVFTPPQDSLDRLYRPQALDVPVLVSRDAPISQLDPDSVGVFTPDAPLLIAAQSTPDAPIAAQPKVVEDDAPELVLMAVRPAWVRVRAADGSVLFEKILDAGEEYVLPATEAPPTLRAGMSGSLYFKLNGELFGPAGTGTNTIRDLALDNEALKENYAVANMDTDPELARIVALAAAADVVVTEE